MAFEVAYSPLLVAGSIAAATMASFTALRLTSSLHGLGAHQRKIRVTESALALGVGIWCMHFIGMLAVKLPLDLSFEPLKTLASALIAVLVTGAGFLLLHFGRRSHGRIWVAGTLTGLGIVSMHYLGMSAVSNCIVTYNPGGVVLATAVGIGASILGIELAYARQSLPGAIAGAIVLGLAISGMHYAAMLFTSFGPSPDAQLVSKPLLDSNQLALVVALISFLISGLFLLSATPDEAGEVATAAVPVDLAAAGVEPASAPPVAASAVLEESPASDIRIPYERDKAVRFLASQAIVTVRADGHYTRLYNGKEELFCPWSISRIARSLQHSDFVRTHRSYIVNKHQILGLRRDGEKAFCIVGGEMSLEVPVSRSRIPQLREILSLEH